MASHNGAVSDPTSGPSSASGPRDYGLARALRARLLGALLMVTGVVVVAVGVLVAAVDLAGVVVAALVVLVVLEVVLAGAVLLGRWYVVRLDETGYRVRFVRGVGQPQARWTEVEDLATAVAGGTKCVVLRLRDGRTTTIPVNVIEGDREAFVDELQRRLDAGHGYRRL